MERQDGEMADLRRRLERVEQQVAAMHSAPPSGSAPGWTSTTRRVTAMEPSAALAHLHDVLNALQAVAKTANERLLFVASADTQTGSGGGPCPVRRTADDDETAQALTRLGGAVSNPLRVKLLQALVLHDERTTADLAAACGTSGGNLYQHLNELHAANLIYQPRRGRYRLTVNGQHAADVLFWAALQVRRSLPPTIGQGGWFPQDTADV